MRMSAMRMSAGARMWRFVALFAVLGLLAAACGGDDDDDGASAAGPSETTAASGEGADAPAGDPIKIGVPMNLTGPASGLGLQTADGVKAWVDWKNDNGGILGRPVEILMRDCESNPQRCAEVTQILIERDDVVGLIGPDGTPTTLSVVPVVNAGETPAVALSGGWPMGLSQEEQKWTFLAFPALSQMFGIYKRELWDPQGMTRIAILGPSGPLIETPKRYFADPEPPLELATVQEFAPGATDITAQMLAIEESDPDYVMVFASGADNATGLAAFETLGVDIPHGPQGLTFGLEGAVSKEALDGIYAATYPNFLIYNELVDESHQAWDVTQDFIDAMEAGGFDLFGGVTAASLGWDSAQSLAQAIEEAGDTDRAAVRDALETQVYSGITGVYERSPENHEGVDGGYSIIQYVDGAWQPVADR